MWQLLLEHKVILPASGTESPQDKQEDLTMRHNVRIVGLPTCPESRPTASVNALLERVFNLDAIPLLDRSHTALNPAAKPRECLCTSGTDAACRSATIQRLSGNKQCIKVNPVIVRLS